MDLLLDLDDCSDTIVREGSVSKSGGVQDSFIQFLSSEEETDDSNESEDEEEETPTIYKTSEDTKTDSEPVHPLLHLFDEPETKPVSKKLSLKKTVDKKKIEKESKPKPLIEKLYDGLTKQSKKTISTINKKSNKDDEIDKLLAKSDILNSDPSEMFCMDPQISKRKAKKLKKEELEKTKGKNWFGLPATEMTEEVKRDLELLKMRSVLDPKRFYKKNDLQVLPKYFQIGKIMDSPRDFYSHRLTKKERKKTLVDELMADAEFNRYNKNKYAEILKEKQKTHYKAWRQAKRLKKKK